MYMGVHEYISGYIWVPMNIYGYTDIYEYVWVYLGIYGTYESSPSASISVTMANAFAA